MTHRLTGQVLVLTQIGIAPGVVTPVGNAPIFADPDEPVGAVVELGVALEALPVPVAVGDVAHHFGFGRAGVLLFNDPLALA